jgi:hypothetical protein
MEARSSKVVAAQAAAACAAALAAASTWVPSPRQAMPSWREWSCGSASFAVREVVTGLPPIHRGISVAAPRAASRALFSEPGSGRPGG